MAEKHNVAMFAVKDGQRIQVGWASPAHEGSRTFEFSPGFDRANTPIEDISFSDDEDAAREASTENAEVPESRSDEATPSPLEGDEGKDSPVIQVSNNETVEIGGGAITEVNEIDEEAEFERELAEEQARLEAEKPQTRREAREEEGGE